MFFRTARLNLPLGRLLLSLLILFVFFLIFSFVFFIIIIIVIFVCVCVFLYFFLFFFSFFSLEDSFLNGKTVCAFKNPKGSLSRIVKSFFYHSVVGFSYLLSVGERHPACFGLETKRAS